MKRKSIITILFLAMGLGIATSSCEDMLTADLERHQDTPAQDTLYSYWGIVKSLQNLAERYVVLGECRGDLVAGTDYVSDSISQIANFEIDKAVDGSCRYLNARDYYHVINSCNSYLAKADTFRVTGTNEKYMIREYAQVEAIRAWVYLQLVQVYGTVPFYTTPMLTTENIDAFMNGNHPTVDRISLVEKLAPRLERVKDVVFPNYNMYQNIVHSLRLMIPVNLVLGDMYLLRGTDADCMKAAAYYYEWIDENEAVMTPNIYYYGMISQRNTPYYLSSGASRIYNNTSVPTKTDETITVIPSEKNKLVGNVNRGLCTLFGYEPEISVADTSGAANIFLFPTEKSELTASAGYTALAKAQDYFERIGGQTGLTLDQLPTRVNDVLHDARQYWVNDFSTDEGINYSLVSKQNPGGAFSTTYPVIYRKSVVWLRFAEAINRAGFPSYAFAILKDGICNNDNWFPTEDEHFMSDKCTFTFEIPALDENGESIPPVVLEFDLAEITAEEIETQLTAKADELKTLYSLKETLSPEGPTYDLSDPAFNIRPNEGNTTVLCNYISYEDYQEAKVTNFMNFDKASFKGSNTKLITSRVNSGDRMSTPTYVSTETGGLSIGIHARGCGIMPTGDKNSYSYEAAVMRTNPEITNVYDPAQKEDVIKAVENLIIDELALESAFEGNRFFDLMRVALRRGEPGFLAEKVAARNGKNHEDYATLLDRLSNPSNWYFKLPNH